MPAINGFSAVLVTQSGAVLAETPIAQSTTHHHVYVETVVPAQPPGHQVLVRIGNHGIDPRPYEARSVQPPSAGASASAEPGDNSCRRMVLVVRVGSDIVFAHTVRSQRDAWMVHGRRVSVSSIVPVVFGQSLASTQAALDDSPDSVTPAISHDDERATTNASKAGGDGRCGGESRCTQTTRVAVELWHCAVRHASDSVSLWPATAAPDPVHASMPSSTCHRMRPFLADEDQADTSNNCGVVSLECTPLTAKPLLLFAIRECSQQESAQLATLGKPLSSLHACWPTCGLSPVHAATRCCQAVDTARHNVNCHGCTVQCSGCRHPPTPRGVQWLTAPAPLSPPHRQLHTVQPITSPTSPLRHMPRFSPRHAGILATGLKARFLINSLLHRRHQQPHQHLHLHLRPHSRTLGQSRAAAAVAAAAAVPDMIVTSVSLPSEPLSATPTGASGDQPPLLPLSPPFTPTRPRTDSTGNVTKHDG
ncbi:hypothetical protein BC831DRAFT_436115 [Entophlyctis helioformis]|nr:hypothetical protein BC831DRAFT_436115 [Entophlyctis helioformis]